MRSGLGSRISVVRARINDLPSCTISASTVSPATAPWTKTALPLSACASPSAPYVIDSMVSFIFLPVIRVVVRTMVAGKSAPNPRLSSNAGRFYKRLFGLAGNERLKA